MDTKNLKQQLIEEVARIQKTNLRRVESSSGMKTIYSSENYRMSKVKGKSGHHGQHGNQNPGRSRVKKKSPDYKIISADLFEDHAQTSEEDKTTIIETASVKADISDHSPDMGAENMVQYRSTSPRGIEAEEIKRNSSVSDRAESEMTLPENTIHDAEGMSRVESQLSEEDHAIQALVSLVETQEARLDEVEAGKEASFDKDGQKTEPIGASIAHPLAESVQFTQTTETQQEDSKIMQSLVAKARKQLVEEGTPGRNLEDINSFFDLKEIISSTPQAGSMHEGNSTPSEIGSVYSGTGSRLDRVESGTWQSSRLVPTKENRDAEISTQSNNGYDVSQDIEREPLVKSTGSLVTKRIRESGNGSSVDGTEDVPPPTRSAVDNVQATEFVTLSIDSEGPSMKMEEAHRMFNPMVADLSSSMEEDFITSRKVVGTELSSSAEVIVHSDHVPEEKDSVNVPSSAETQREDIQYRNEIEEHQQTLNTSATKSDISTSHPYVEHHAFPTGITTIEAGDGQEELSSSSEVILPSDQMSEISSKRTSSSIESPRIDSSDQNEVDPQQTVEMLDVREQSKVADLVIRSEQVHEKISSKRSSSIDNSFTGGPPDIELEPHQYPISNIESTKLPPRDHVEVYQHEATEDLTSKRSSSSEETHRDGSPSGEVKPIPFLDISVNDSDSGKDGFDGQNFPTVNYNDPVIDFQKRLNVEDETNGSVSITTTEANHRDSKQEIDFGTESLGSQNEIDRGHISKTFKTNVVAGIHKDESEMEQDMRIVTSVGSGKNIDQIENTEALQLKPLTGTSNIAGIDTLDGTVIAGRAQSTTERLAPIGAEKEDLRKHDISSNTTNSTKNANIPQVNGVALMASTIERISKSHSSSSIGSKGDGDDDSVWTSSGGLPTESQPRKYSTVTENNNSDMKTISDMVDVRSIAKQLETVLDFKKMMRLHSNSEQVETTVEEERDASSKDRPVKRIIAQAQDPKNAFGQVLTEIFQKTRLRNVQYDSDTPDSSMNTSAHERVTDTHAIGIIRTEEHNTISDNIGHNEPGPAISRVYISSDIVVGDNELPVPPGIEIDHEYNKLQTQSPVKLTLPENTTETFPNKPRYADYYVNNQVTEDPNPPISSPSENNEENTAHDRDYWIETDEKRDVWGSATVTEIIVNRADPHVTDYPNQGNTEIDVRRERPISLENPHVWDYNPRRDASLHGTLRENLITTGEERPHVTSLRQQITSQTEPDGKGYRVEEFSLEREDLEPEKWRREINGVFTTNEFTTESGLAFQTKSPVDAALYRYANTSDSETTKYSSGEEEFSYIPENLSHKTTSTIYVNSQSSERPETSNFSREDDTVQGSLFYQSHGSIETDNSALRSPVRYEEKPAQPLRLYDINIEKKEDRSGHMTFSSSGRSEQAVKLGFDHPVTTQQRTGEGIFGEDEKLLSSGLRSNYTSESRSGEQRNPNRATNYSLFYDGYDDSFSVPQTTNDEVTEDFIDQRKYRDRSPARSFHSTSPSKYNKNKNMAYLLTGKENVHADYNRSGHSTPQRKDLYVQEEYLVSPTAADDRRGSHGSTNYLADKQAGQDFFHFQAPGNSDRESEVKGEKMQQVERKEQRVLNSGPGHFEPLPDTYIGSSSKAPEPVPIRIQVNGSELKPETVSQTSSVSHHGSRASSDRGKTDSTDGKKHKSEHKRTERVTKTVTTHSHNGSQTSDRPDYPHGYNVIRVDSLDPDVRRRERREIKVTSTNKTKARGDDNISISSSSSQSSSSVAEALNSFDAAINSGSRHNVSPDNRRVYSDNSGVQKVRVDYDPNTRMYSKGEPKPQQFVKVKDYRVHRESDHEKRPKVHERQNGSAKDVQHLIKSLEKETRKPHRPIPGVDRDAFSYHVTSSGNENNNRFNEVDVTTREAMRDRGKSGQGSSQVIKRYTEEKIVEDVTPEATLHVATDPGGHGSRTIVLQNGQPSKNIVFHPPASVDRSDSDLTVRINDSRDSFRRDNNSGGETKYYVETSSAPRGRTHTEKVRVVKKERTDNSHRRRHSLSSSESGSSDSEEERGRKPKSGKVSTVLYDFSSPKHPSLSNVVHLEGADDLKSSSDKIRSQEIYSSPRDTDKPHRIRSSSESSLSDQEQRKSGKVVKTKSSDELRLSKDLYSRNHPNYKSENVFYEHYHVKRENPMYAGGDSKVLYVSPPSKTSHRNKNATREIYVDTKGHSPNRLSSSFSSISPTGSPTPDDKHVTTVSFDESFNRKRSASPSSEDAYKSKVHVKKHHVVKTERVRSADSDNELYVRSSRSSPYRVVSPYQDVHNVTGKGEKHRHRRGSDTDSDSRTGSHRSTINISKSPERRREHEAPAVLSIPLSKEPVAMTIPAMHETKYVTNKSEKVELKRSSSLDSMRDMVDNDSEKYRSEKVLYVGSSSDGPSSPEMKSPNSPYVSTITILNRKLNVQDPNGDSGMGAEIISSDDDIRYRSQLHPVREEVVYATKEAHRPETKQRRSEKHTKTYTSYEEIRDKDNYEYVAPKQHTTRVREERRIPIREEHISPIKQDRAKTVRESLHERLSNMSYEQRQEPQRVEQSTVDSDMKVVRGQFVIRNSMDISLDEEDSLALDDNINIFDNSFTLSKENPLYQSDPDLYKKFESETVEERTRRIKDPVHVRPETVQRVTQVHVSANPPRDEVDTHLNNWERKMYSTRERDEVRRVRPKMSPSSGRLHYLRNDLDVPYAEGDFGDGFEDIIKNTRATAVKSAPNRKKQNLSALLLSRLAQIDSKDITQHIDVEHHNEEIYGDINFIHADGSKTGAEDTTNFDSVSEHIDLMLKEGKALITIKVTAERIIPIDYEFNVWRKSQAIVTRNIEIDLKANDQRRRLYEHVMDTTPSKMIGSGSSSHGYVDSNEAVLSSKDTLKLFSRLLSVAEKDDKAIEKDEVHYESKHRERSDSLPSLSNADMLY